MLVHKSIFFPVSLEASIAPDNVVRLIDLSVNSLALSDFGFKLDFIERGRPAFHPTDLVVTRSYSHTTSPKFS